MSKAHVLFLSLLLSLPSLSASAEPIPAKARLRDGSHDFDFLFGRWKLHHRRLKEVLAGSTTWYEFDMVSTTRPLWGGAANLDEFIADTPTGPIQGLSLRLYNPSSAQWSIYWVNRTAGYLDKPVVGEFKNGRGEFHDQEEFRGRMIFVRYVWSNITPTSAHWEQAFSVDGGQTWETNWTTDLTRLAEPERSP